MDGVQEKLSVIGQGAFAIVQSFKVKKAREGIRFGRECVPLEYDDFLDLLGKNSGDVTWLLKHTANEVRLNPMHVLFFLYAACLETSSHYPLLRSNPSSA